MKPILFLTLVLFCSASITNAQEQAAPAIKSLQKVMTLKIDRPGGTDGAAVAWHPLEKKYYAAQAGADAPMMIFDEKGKKITATDLKAGVDVRGLWYNPKSRTLQASTASNNGWYEYAVNERGVPENRRRITIETGIHGAQAVGAYDYRSDAVWFYDNTTAMAESRGLNGLASVEKTKLKLGSTSKDAVTDEEIAQQKASYNENAIVYTGEIGLLNVAKKQVELYDPGPGVMTRALKLPESAPVSKSLNFSYSNGIYWLFNKGTREWCGYR